MILRTNGLFSEHPVVSIALTAYPSIADRSNGGIGLFAMISSVNILLFGEISLILSSSLGYLSKVFKHLLMASLSLILLINPFNLTSVKLKLSPCVVENDYGYL